MSMTVSVRVQHNSMSKAAGQRRHDARLGNVPTYVDQDRSDDNSIIQPTMMEGEARRQCEALRAQNDHKRSMKSTAAVLTAGVITFGTDAQPVIEALDKEKQDQLYQDVAERIATELDTRLVGLAVHRDEAAPHAHFNLLAVNRQGLPLSKVITKDQAKHLQDIAGQVLAEHGLAEITRGKSKEQRILEGEDPSKTIHRSVAQLHKDLPREIEAAQEKLAKNLALIEKAKQDLEKETAGREEKIQKRLASYEKRAGDAQAQLERLESLIPESDQPAPVVTVTARDIEDWKPKKLGLFREETEQGAADRANASPTIRDANRLIADQQQALKFSANREERERRDRERAERERDALKQKYEHGLIPMQHEKVQRLADEIRKENQKQQQAEQERAQEMKRERSSKSKGRGLGDDGLEL